MRHLKTYLLLALLLPWVTVAGAETQYDVEIILFEHASDRAGDNERWRPEVVIPRRDRTLHFDDDGETSAPLMSETPEEFRPLEEEDLRLRDERQRLENASAYDVLQHRAWRQPALDPDEAVGVRIRAGEPTRVRLPRRATGPLTQPVRIEAILARARAGHDDPVSRSAATEPLFATGVLPERESALLYPLDGSVRVEVERYLHVYANLYRSTAVDWPDDELREHIQADASRAAAANAGGDAEGSQEQDDEQGQAGNAEVGEAANLLADDSDEAVIDSQTFALGPDGQKMISFPFVQQRRMRSGNLHYLDHPVIGMLVLITPHETEDEGAGAE